MLKIIRDIFIVYALVCLPISILFFIDGGSSAFGEALITMSLFPFAILFFIFFIIGLFSDDSSHSSRSSSDSKDKYLDVASALNHGMSAEDILKYNTGDWDTRSKYRDKALNIDKSDKFYMG